MSKQAKVYLATALAERDEALPARLRAIGAIYGVSVALPSRGRGRWRRMQEELADADAVLGIISKEGALRLESMLPAIMVGGNRHYAKPVIVLLERGARVVALPSSVRVVPFHKGIGPGKRLPLELEAIDKALKTSPRRVRRVVMALAQLAQGMLGLGEVGRRASA